MAYPITLGDLIVLLRHQPQDHHVVFDFGSAIPTDVDSYRGYYEQLAIGYEMGLASGCPQSDGHDPDNLCTVAELLERLQDVLGRTYSGWKGGEYEMGEHTRMWAANAGHSTSTAITGIASCTWQTVLTTAFVD